MVKNSRNFAPFLPDFWINSAYLHKLRHFSSYFRLILSTFSHPEITAENIWFFRIFPEQPINNIIVF